MKKISFFFIALSMIISSCAAPVHITPIVESNNIPTDTPIPTVTPTPILEPTSAPTLPPTPSPTPTLVLAPTPMEWELVPFYEKDIQYKLKGVLIKARLIIDESMSSKIESIEISDEVLADVVARWMFLVWRQRNGFSDWNDDSWFDINEYMEMWAKAQDSGLESDWKKVQINDVWANDLTDGDGYVQKTYDFWPMYFGDDAPDGVTPLNLVTLAIVDQGKYNNITSLLVEGAGTNLNVGDLIIYRSFDWEYYLEYFQSSPHSMTLDNQFARVFSFTSTWLALNWGINGFVKTLFGNDIIYIIILEQVNVTYK